MNRSLFKIGRQTKSLLFVRPDYHCSYFYRDELRRLGWKVDVYVPWDYPEHLLFSETDIVRPPRIASSGSKLLRAINAILEDAWFIFRSWRYRYHLYYGRPPQWLARWERLFPRGLGDLSLKISRRLGVRLVYLPTGCHDILTKQQFTELDGGNVCGNCGAWDRCSDQLNIKNFVRVRRFFAAGIGLGETPTDQFRATILRWKALDLNLWSPGLAIPPEHRLPKTSALRIVHSFSSNGRDFRGRNIKGSPFVKAAVDRLIGEGHDVELLHFTDVMSRNMRFFQAQADIVVEQLIYGWWGSTGVETMALGKPVVCYVRPAWKQAFLAAFPEYDDLPVVEANTESVYQVLKDLVSDANARKLAGQRSREFALRHFDSARNATELETALLGIDGWTTCDPRV